MGRTDGLDDYMQKSPIESRVVVVYLPMVTLHVAKQYSLWVELSMSSIGRSKLICIQEVKDWVTKEREGSSRLKVFYFTCIDQSGFVMHGEMVEAYEQGYVSEWGRDIPVRVSP